MPLIAQEHYAPERIAKEDRPASRTPATTLLVSVEMYCSYCPGSGIASIGFPKQYASEINNGKRPSAGSKQCLCVSFAPVPASALHAYNAATIE